MIWITISSLLFGLVHPGSKFILSSGINLSEFCLLYVGIRLFIQIPFFYKQMAIYSEKKTYPWKLLILFGLIGASLQLSEFFGLYKGLPVAIVTFLVYSHPIWSAILSRFINKENLNSSALLRIFIGIVGIFWISNDTFSQSNLVDTRVFFPILAGVFIALWSSLSNKISKTGLSTIEISFFYDLFAFISLLIFISISSNLADSILKIKVWASSLEHIVIIILFSIFIGLLPNYLFYLGSKHVSNLNASLLLLIEPLVASSFAYFFMNERLSSNFLFGAILILLSGFSISSLSKILTPMKYIVTVPFITASLFLFPSISYSKKIIFVEFSPKNLTDYTTSNELKLIENSTTLALNKTKSIFPNCIVTFEKNIKYGSEEEIYSLINNHVKAEKDQSTIVGLSRSAFATIGAKASIGSSIKGLSIGASTTRFPSINSNFFSIASPVDQQIIAIKEKANSIGCHQIAGVFDPQDSLSSELHSKFTSIINNQILDFNNLDTQLKKSNINCVFVGLNLSKSSRVFDLISANKEIKYVFGTGDWNIHAEELTNILKTSKLNSVKQIFSPTGWTSSLNKNSKRYSDDLKKHFNQTPNPIGAYTYDSILISMETLCSTKTYFQVIESGKVKKHLLRSYSGISKSNNFLSKIHMKEWR